GILRGFPVEEDAAEDDLGILDQAAYENLLSNKTKVVAVTHVSNVLGTINPIARMAAKAHEVGAIVVCDGAQAVPHMAVDIASLGCDFYAGTGHKMCAPTGIGFLWGRESILESMEPFHGGGDMILDVWIDHSTYNEIPYKFEAGTPPISQAVGLSAAIDYLNNIGWDAIREHEVEITRYALERLAALPDITVYGPKDADIKAGLVSFNIGDIHPHDVGTILDGKGVAIRAGHHCAKPLMRKLGVGATNRASFYIYNTHSDVDALVDALESCREMFG
ncbi:MAG: aminotransferase class V-fold PLP-dependent enzyme, partial [Actinomycetota bacterium]